MFSRIIKIGWASCLLALCAGTLKAQQYNETTDFLKANGVWCFGVGAGLDFNTRLPFKFNSGVTSMEGVVSVSSRYTGKLLFSAGASFCRGWNQSTMPNGSGLLGDQDGSCTQGKCVVPMIGSAGKYYLFSLEGNGSPPTIVRSGKLYYSVVDTALNFGFGDIVPTQKNILIDSGFTEGMIGIPGNSCDAWLLLHKRDSAIFVAYHITDQGIDVNNPVISHAGQQIQGAGAYNLGGMAVSPDRSMVVATSGKPSPGNPAIPGAVVCKFDPNTGVVSNSLTLINSAFTYAACFSPDNTKVYVTSSAVSGTDADLVQFDLSNYTQAAVYSSITSVAPSPTYSNFYGAMKLYNDTIYVVGIPSSTFLDRINKPNLKGTACDYDTAAISLYFNARNQWGLPNDVVYPLDGGTSRLTVSLCGDEYTLNGKTYRKSGIYTQVFPNELGCDSMVVIDLTLNGELAHPYITVHDFDLSTSLPYSSYQWMLDSVVMPGATSRVYTVVKNGDYQVIVSNGQGCTDTSEVYRVNNYTGIDDLNGLSRQITIHPNPTTDKVYISAPMPVQVSLNSIEGRRILEEDNPASITMERLAPGVYFLRISSQGRLIKVEKIIKE